MITAVLFLCVVSAWIKTEIQSFPRERSDLKEISGTILFDDGYKLSGKGSIRNTSLTITDSKNVASEFNCWYSDFENPCFSQKDRKDLDGKLATALWNDVQLFFVMNIKYVFELDVGGRKIVAHRSGDYHYPPALWFYRAVILTMLILLLKLFRGSHPTHQDREPRTDNRG